MCYNDSGGSMENYIVGTYKQKIFQADSGYVIGLFKVKDSDIEQMIKDAEKHAEEDKKVKEAVEARNHADALIHTTEKTLKDNGDKVAASDKEAIETAIKELKDVLDSNDAEKIKAKTENLTQVSLKLGEALYKQQQEAAAAGAASGNGEEAPKAEPSSDGETVVDADFEEVKK